MGLVSPLHYETYMIDVIPPGLLKAPLLSNHYLNARSAFTATPTNWLKRKRKKRKKIPRQTDYGQAIQYFPGTSLAAIIAIGIFRIN